MNLPMHFCLRSMRQIKHVGSKYCAVFSHVERCSKLSPAALSQAALEKPYGKTEGVERSELMKNLLAGNTLDQHKKCATKRSRSYQNISQVEKRPCTSESGQCYYKNQLVWQDILLGPKHAGRQLKENSNLIGVSHEMWYCTNIDDACPKKHFERNCVEFSVVDRAQCSGMKDSSVGERRASTGPSSEQLSIILLRLREELPHFFEGHHGYSIYSKDILFVNKITRTTTRTLKSYKYLMKLMAYAGKLFWTKASLDVLRITKHSEDNTIKVRWTAKGIPWYQLPFFLLSWKPESLFYRYVDGFSIFEVGRDGLVHCHRLDKVMPTSTPERQKWNLPAALLGFGVGQYTPDSCLGEYTPDSCDAFQVKVKKC